MRKLLPRRETVYSSRKWHADVFKLRGNKCIFCGAHATDAMHILRRGTKLGPLRYCDPRLGVPGCRRCHDIENVGGLHFSFALRLEATRAHNLYAKIKLQEPTE